MPHCVHNGLMHPISFQQDVCENLLHLEKGRGGGGFCHQTLNFIRNVNLVKRQIEKNRGKENKCLHRISETKEKYKFVNIYLPKDKYIFKFVHFNSCITVLCPCYKRKVYASFFVICFLFLQEPHHHSTSKLGPFPSARKITLHKSARGIMLMLMSISISFFSVAALL